MKKGVNMQLRCQGFTLLEMLVAMVILGLLTVLMFSLLNNVSGFIGISNNQREMTVQARQAFSRIGMDVANQIRRQDIPYGYTPNIFQFYTAGNSSDGTRGIMLVGYRISGTSCALERGTHGFDWDTPVGWFLPAPISNSYQSTFTPAITDSNWQELSPVIFRFNVSYLYNAPDATTACTGAPTLYATPPAKVNDLQALVVTMAILDSSSRNRLSTDQLKSFGAALPDPDASHPDALIYWQNTIAQSGFVSTANVPASTANMVRCYQRYFPVK